MGRSVAAASCAPFPAERPPLRARQEDVLLLARHFLQRYAPTGTEPKQLTASAVERLLAHAWPGNVRELEQVIRAAAAMAPESEIAAADLGLPRATASDNPEPAGFDAYIDLPLTEAKQQLVEAFERALSRNGGNVSAAARDLGIHRQSLQQKMSQREIDVDRAR